MGRSDVGSLNEIPCKFERSCWPELLICERLVNSLALHFSHPWSEEDMSNVRTVEMIRRTLLACWKPIVETMKILKHPKYEPTIPSDDLILVPKELLRDSFLRLENLQTLPHVGHASGLSPGILEDSFDSLVQADSDNLSEDRAVPQELLDLNYRFGVASAIRNKH